MVAALRQTVDDFFVGEYRPEGRAPVDGDFVDVGESAVMELCEDPLRPLVVFRVGRADFTVPIV